MSTLTVSRVGPAVEDGIVQLVDMVKQMGRKGDLTESQNRKMVAYLGNVDEMRQQIVVMVQRYENDEHVLKRLLSLIDRIDDVKQLAEKSQTSLPEDSGAPTAATTSEKDLTKQYDTIFNPLMVSNINILDVSGLFASEIRPEELENLDADDEEEADAGDEFWDHNDDLSNLATVEDLPQDINSINLSMSNSNLPSLSPDPESNQSHRPPLPPIPFSSPPPPPPPPTASSPLPPLASPSPPPPPPPPPVSSLRSQLPTQQSKEKRRKGKQPVKSASESESGSESASEDTGSSSDGAGQEGIGGGGRPITIGHRNGLSLDSAPTLKNVRWRSAVIIGSSSSRDPPPAPPLPPMKKSKTGPCDPVLCKICYDEYNRIEQLHGFKECGHTYCRECMDDYLTTNINEGAVLDLTCPFPECETEVAPDDIKRVCTSTTFEKYERFTVIASLRMDPDARWCPNPYCNNGIKANPKEPWVYCNACHLEFCFHCMAERHDGAACGKEALDFLAKKRESEEQAIQQFNAFANEFKALVKPCPTCHAYIEKNDGCNHMTCGNPTCKTQFCWLCLNLYLSDHFSNNTDFPNCFEKQYWTPMEESYMNPIPPPYVPRSRLRGVAGIARKVGIYVGVGVAVVTLGVPAAVIGGPVYGCFKLHKRLKARRRQRPAYAPDPNFVPPSPARIREAAQEALRLRRLESEIAHERRRV